MIFAVLFTGQWDKLRRVFDNLKSGRFIKEDELERFGNSIEQRLRNHIMAQDLGWVPLKDATVRKKGHATIYIENRDYLKSIKVRVSKKGMLSRTIMVRPEGNHPSGMSMSEIANVLEYGTSKIRARPLWRPTFKEVQAEFSNFAKNLIELD